MARTIGIVGAGISGLLACKYALAKGYHPLVFESRSTVGGVWTKTIETTKLQTSKSSYQFSDFPWPSYVETLYPTQHQVYDYVQSYAKHFDLLKHIRFNTKAVSIKYEGPSNDEIQSWELWSGNGDPFGNKGKWVITFLDLLNQQTQTLEVDFVILCVGRFSDVPNMPEFPLGKGPEIFKGQVIHSMDYSGLDYITATNLVRGKRVVVVGFQKSALDITMECSKLNGVENPCTVICRTPHWNAAESFPWKKLYSNRFSQLMLHKPGEGLLLNLLASLLSPLRWGISKFVENYIKKKHPMKKYGMVPNHSFLQEMNSCSVATIPTGFYENVEKGSIILKRSKSFSFNKQGILLHHFNTHAPITEAIMCDLVIFATGFKGDLKLQNIFASPFFQHLIIGCPNNTLPLYRFNTKVVSIKYEGPSHEEIQSWALWGGNGLPFNGKGKWIVTTQHLLNQSIKEYEADFVILCVGRYTGLPNKPEFPIGKGPEVFEGKVLHASEYAALDNESARDLVKGKHVTVVGFQKYALDIATESSIANGVEHPCTVLYRTPHWHMPDHFPWGIAITYLYLNRFSELLVHKPGEGLLLFFLACILSPLRWGISKLVELDIKRKLPLKKYGVIPKHSFLLEMNSCGISTMPKGFYENVEKGSIILKKSPNNISFFKEGVVVDENEYVKSELVILATGFNGDQKLKDIFESQTFQDYIYGSSKATVPLHRECIHPRIPQLAIIGYSESIANLFTSEMRCRWLFEFLDGKFKLPTIHEMEKQILEWDKFMKRYSGKYYRKSCVGALHVWYNDQLCKDMGLNPKRKNGFWAELFDPYGPMDYV